MASRPISRGASRLTRTTGGEPGTIYHPTFLYECLWDIGVAGLVIWLDRKLKLGYGRAFALYVMAYTFGRGWIEYLRIDDANHFFGVRLNVWTSVVLFILAAAYFVIMGRRHPGRETDVEPIPTDDADAVDEPADADAEVEEHSRDETADEADDGADDEVDDDAEDEQVRST